MGNSQSSEQTTKIKNEMITQINTEVSNIFSNSFSSENQNTCMNSIDQLISVDGDLEITGNNVLITNKAKASVECMLEKSSTQEIQQQISNSLMTAVEKVLGNDTMNKLEQEAKTQLGTLFGNTNDAKTSTDVENKTITDIKTGVLTTVENKITSKVISEAKIFMKQVIQLKGKLKISGNDVTIKNEADSFLKAGQISNEINKLINLAVNSNTVTEKIEAQNKVVNDTTQKATSTGFAEIFESIGKMFSSIFTGLMGPGIIIVGIIILTMIMKSMMSRQSGQPYSLSSSSQPYPQYPYQPYPPYPLNK